MKKILIIIFCLPVILFGQSVPQGVNYQAVATNSLGIELINQTISIRASVLSNSANGTTEWEEIHTTTTDTFGLFNLIIGQGTSTGNGSTSNFSDINWGANTHFLKIEMDINGGSTYSHMGTNQMMSVPYALYAENTNIDYDSIASILSNDSIFVTSVSGGIKRATDFLYPEGLDGDIVHHNFSNSYTVPFGKNLYIINYYNSFGQSNALQIDGNTIYSGYSNNNGGSPGQHRLINPIIVRSGQVVSSTSSNANTTFIGLLTNEVVVPLTHDLDSNYIVSSGKKLIITNIYSNSQNGSLIIDGNTAYSGYSNNDGGSAGQKRFYNSILVSGGQIVTGNYDINFNGYLVDDDYFSGSSTSNSSTSSLDSITIANMIAASSNSTINYNFPDGLGGDAISTVFTQTSSCCPYTVPPGKRLYILSTTSSTVRVNGNAVGRPINGTFIICNSGDIVEPVGNGNYHFNGILIDNVSDVDAISTVFTQTSSCCPYTVPSAKKLYILSTTSSTVRVNGNAVGRPIDGTFIFCNSGDIVEPFGSGNYHFNGYLVDNDYFSSSSGGSSSSNTTSLGPTFIDPVLITNTLCGSGSLLNDSIRINVDSILGQNVSSLIIHSDFSAPGVSSFDNFDLDVSSYNGIFSTPVFSMITKYHVLGYATEVTDVNNQIILPNSNSGIINLVITGTATSNSAPACNLLSGTIKIVGYY